MFTRIIVIAAALTLPAVAAAQQGSRIRVWPQCQTVCPPVIGTIDRFLEDSVRIRDERTRTVTTLPLSVMASAEIPNGRGSNVGAGIAMGALVGILSGVLIASGGTDAPAPGEFRVPDPGILLAPVLGIALGIVVGINGGKERWVPASEAARVAGR